VNYFSISRIISQIIFLSTHLMKAFFAHHKVDNPVNKRKKIKHRRDCAIIITHFRRLSMKKILILNGSFRKGNTDKTLVPVREALSEKETEIREFMIRDLIDTRCYGCALAITKGKEFCPTYETEKELLRQLEWCDALIIASPVYNGRETFIIKAMFDKFAFLVHRPRFFNKKAMVIVTRGNMFSAAIKYISKTLSQWGFHVTVKCGEPELPVLKNHLVPKTVQKIRNKTNRFYHSLDSAGKTPGIGDKLWFEVWKLNAEMGEKGNKTDFNYWKENGWFESDYYYDTRINPVSRLISSILRPVIKGQMKKTFKGY